MVKRYAHENLALGSCSVFTTFLPFGAGYIPVHESVSCAGMGGPEPVCNRLAVLDNGHCLAGIRWDALFYEAFHVSWWPV